MRGNLRIAVRETGDGLGIHIPPARNYLAVVFLLFWLCGWAAGEFFAFREFFGGGISVPDVFLLIWIIPWTVGGAGVLWVILWQLFGVERLYFTANALVREWSVLALSRRRIVHGNDIATVTVDSGVSNDLAGFGAVNVKTTGRSMRIGSGLTRYEAELVAKLIRDAAAAGEAETETEAPRVSVHPCSSICPK